jgi:tetratricopeptide (TPR) repeat protein
LQYLGSLHQVRGESDEALRYFQEALELERSSKGNQHLRVGKLLNVIGNICLQKGYIDQMMDCLIEAARICNIHDESLVVAGFKLYGISKLHPECAKVA